MRIIATSLVGLMAAMVPARAAGEGIWQWTHEASGSGTANVFDGGPPVFDERSTTGPNDAIMTLGAVDRTSTPGVLGAEAAATGRSHIESASDTTFRFVETFLVGYFPSSFPGGDNPGGEAEGELSSVIEFVMPADEIGWVYGLGIDNTFPFPFTGSASVAVENVTQSLTLLELSSEVSTVQTTLNGNTGDLIRITSLMSGSGGMGPGSGKEYEAFLGMTFTIPEPATFFLLLAGCVAVGRGRHLQRT